MKCKKKTPLAKNGNDRGTCNKPANHNGRCRGNGTCHRCGERITSTNSPSSIVERGAGLCTKCNVEYQREKHGIQPRIYQAHQTEECDYTFVRCGCSGVLPKIGQSNCFATYGYRENCRENWTCRISKIMLASRMAAKRRGYLP